MKTIFALSIAAALGAELAAAQGQPSVAEVQCTAYRRPNYDDCDSVIEFFEMKDNDDVFHENGEDDLPEPSCKWWFWDDGNCRITHCFEMTNDEAGGPMKRTGADMAHDYRQIKDNCDGYRAGGTFHETFALLDVFNDEDQVSSSSTPALKNVKRGDGGFVEAESSFEDYLEWRKGSTQTNEHLDNVHHGDDAEAADADRVDRLARAIAEVKEKRDDIDDDDDWKMPLSALGVRNSGAFDRGPRMSSGVGYKYEVSESTTFSVSTSVEVGGAFKIFTASVGIETSMEESFTITEGLTFDVDCPGQGQVSFYPFYDYYEVMFSPSLTWVDIWVPVHSGKHVDGEIAISCLG